MPVMRSVYQLSSLSTSSLTPFENLGRGKQEYKTREGGVDVQTSVTGAHKA